MLEYPLLLVFPAAMALAAVMDVMTMTIPNRISLFLLAAFLALAPFAGLSWNAFSMHLAIGLAVLLVGVAMFSVGWVGGGDAKLLSAAALWVGPALLPMYLAHVAIVGGVLAIAVLAYRRWVPAQALPLPEWARKLHASGTGIPYGVAIAGGAMMIYPSTPWFLAFAS